MAVDCELAFCSRCSLLVSRLVGGALHLPNACEDRGGCGPSLWQVLDEGDTFAAGVDHATGLGHCVSEGREETGGAPARAPSGLLFLPRVP